MKPRRPPARKPSHRKGRVDMYIHGLPRGRFDARIAVALERIATRLEALTHTDPAEQRAVDQLTDNLRRHNDELAATLSEHDAPTTTKKKR